MKYPDFYIHPQMVGDFIAKDHFDMILEIKNKYVKTTKQKKLFNSIVDLNNDDWHYYCNGLDKKYISQIRYCLRHIDKIKPFDLLVHIEVNHSMLKSDLLRYLELLAFTYDYDRYLADYIHNLAFYGMSKEESTNRFNEYGKTLKTKYNYQI